MLKIDGKTTPHDYFVFPEMNLSSARAEMIRNEFSLIVSADDLIKEMSNEYEDWVTESKIDDQICGGPQDELAEAGYPELHDLVKIPELIELTFGHYLIKELFDKFLPSKIVKYKFWFDEITRCSINGTLIMFEGICYSREKT